ncbi:hypothetical protein LTR94_012912 [Friedmanniomyces endolithicus]|nr:hypothetical protein LTR94_012912 [Friedmanniomyces endolithicus]
MLMYREPGVAVVEDRTIREDPALSLKLGSIVMPYFYSASWGDIRRRKLVHSESAICRVGDGRPKEVHSPLTLDEYCHPWLAPEVLLDRNQDQVVWRYERSHIREAPTHDESELVLWKYKEGELIPTKPKSVSRGICDAASVLMVHQVWIYLVDDVFVFAFPEDALREAPIEKALSPRPVRFENGRSMRFRRTFNTLSTFHRLKSIVSVTAQVEAYLNENSPHDQTMAASDGKEYFRMISDIREELSMIFSVISQQEEVWREMNTILKHLFPGKVEPYMTERMSATTEYIQKLKRQIDGLDKDAERVQVSIPRILDLKRSCAGTKESHWTAVMDAPVFGLAVAIIISTPLSFVMARLAVPRDSFFMAEDLKRRLLQWMTGTSKIVSPIITAVGAVSAYRFFKESTRWCPAPVSWWMQKLHELRHNNAPRAEKAGRGSKEPDVGSLDGADVTARK